MILQSILSFIAINPSVGIDDANITQAYGFNLASGHGYVYNVGGEKVEGSTSALWTLTNTIAFFTPKPEFLLTVASFIISGAILFISALTSLRLTGSYIAGIATIWSFCFYPNLFGWWLYSLMDTATYVFLMVVTIYLMVFSSRPKKNIVMYCLFIILPTARPEGIASAIGIIFLYWFFFSEYHSNKPQLIKYALITLSSIIVLSFLRFLYFGVPFPNTFYAKTSTDLLGQFKQGTLYVINFLESSENYLIAVSCLFVFVFAAQMKKGLKKSYIFFSLVFVLCGMLVYVLLGGDHFSGFRFFHFLYPIVIPLIVSCIWLALKECKMDIQPIVRNLFLTMVTILVSITSYSYYIFNQNYSMEYRIAENGRHQGEYLDNLIGSDLSVGVLAAGGFRMGYKGDVYDLLGLNWSEMAHSENETNAQLMKNHGGFDPDVFLNKSPDIAFPKPIGCRDIPNQVLNRFELDITHSVTEGSKFNNIYELYFDNNISFYALKFNSNRLLAAGFTPYSQIVRGSESASTIAN